MRIIETFICLLGDKYVKIHRGRDKRNNSVYFIEHHNGNIVPIYEDEFETIKSKQS